MANRKALPRIPAPALCCLAQERPPGPTRPNTNRRMKWEKATLRTPRTWVEVTTPPASGNIGASKMGIAFPSSGDRGNTAMPLRSRRIPTSGKARRLQSSTPKGSLSPWQITTRCGATSIPNNCWPSWGW